MRVAEEAVRAVLVVMETERKWMKESRFGGNQRESQIRGWSAVTTDKGELAVFSTSAALALHVTWSERTHTGFS
jgi:hypothetical protein